MPHHTPLIGTIVAGFVFAFIMGALAHRLRMPPIAGYLLAGVIVGPSTPGFIADAELASSVEMGEPSRTVLVGYGHVGQAIARRLLGGRHELVVVEDQRDTAGLARDAGLPVVVADATAAGVLEKMHLGSAAVLLVAIPEGVEAGVIVRRARALNHALHIVARAHSREEALDLIHWGANEVILA
jgi:monovalent cation:H+ antiporter-2, CPA2 family